jgi:transposase InsO family protein
VSAIVAGFGSRPDAASGRDEEPPPRRKRGKRLVSPEAKRRPKLTGERRLLILDAWQRSGLPAKDFAPLVQIAPHTLYAWRKRFKELGPAGLMDKPKGGPRGSRLPEATKRVILMLKREHPEYGGDRISDELARGPGLGASPNAVLRVLKEAGYEVEDVRTSPHRDKKRRFERAKPGQLWQTDLFTFVLKRQNRRVHLVAYLDDHSRFVTGFGLHASASTELVLEVLRAAISSYGAPAEILTDNGPQYVSWRGRSKFSKELDKYGIKQVVSKPKRPQTLGKVERLWGTVWRECVERAVFLDLADARRRLAFFFDHYNFHRPHRGIGGLVPADRFFGAASEVRSMLQSRVAANALELARGGVPQRPFYLTGQVGGKQFALHAAGERVYLSRPDAECEEVELVAPDDEVTPSEVPGDEGAASEGAADPLTPAGPASSVERGLEHERAPAPGASALDDAMAVLRESLASPPPKPEVSSPESVPAASTPSTPEEAPEVYDE